MTDFLFEPAAGDGADVYTHRALEWQFGGEWRALRFPERALVAADYYLAYAEDAIGVGEYQRRIGRGNLASYAACLAAGHER